MDFAGKILMLRGFVRTDNVSDFVLYFGFLISGTGKAWVDDLQLLVDGKLIWEAPKAERPQTVLDRDRQFKLDTGQYLLPPKLEWTGDEQLLGAELSRSLRASQECRHTSGLPLAVKVKRF